MTWRGKWLLWMRAFPHSAAIACLMLIAASWFVAFYISSIERQKAVDEAMKQSDSLVRLFEHDTIDILGRFDRTLLLLRKSYEDDPAHFDLRRWAEQAALISDDSILLVLIGSDGYIKATTSRSGGPLPYLGDRPHVQKQLQATNDELLISDPVVGRTTKRNSLVLLRRLRNPDGSTAGLISLSINPNFIEPFYRSAKLGTSGSISIRNQNNVVLAAQGFSANEVGRKIPHGEAIEGSPRSGHYWGVGAMDGVKRLIAFRASDKYGLYFNAGLSEDSILRDYRAHRTAYMAAASIITLLVLMAVGFAIRYQIRLGNSQRSLRELNDEISRQNLHFDAALTNMPSGLAMFDADGRLAVWNERYEQIYRMPPGVVRQGVSVTEIARYSAENRGASFDAATFVENLRRELRETGKSLATNHLADGRIVSIVKTAVAGGGWVSLHEDVTAQRMQARLVEEKAAELELANARFNAALQYMSHGICLYDPDQRVVVANPRYAEIYRLREDQVKPGTHIREILQARCEAGTNFAVDPDAYTTVNVRRASETMELADGRVVVIKRQQMSNGGWLTTHEDVTTEKISEKLLAEKAAELEVMNTRFSTALANMAQGLCMFDGEQRLTVWNDRFAELYNVPPHLLKVGTPYADISAFRISRYLNKPIDDPEVKARVAEMVALASDASRIDETPDGRFILLSRQPMRGGGWVALMEDITERRRAEAEIVHLARHDVLTGLANRAEFNARLEEASKRLKRNGGNVTVMMIDLDRFKTVNDTLGHLAGDQLLSEVARRLQATLRETDVLARLGGDEFAVIQEGGTEQREGAVALALRIIDAVSPPFNLGGQEVAVGASVGIALAPENGVEPGELLKRADLALYAVKSNGRNDFCLFKDEMLEIVNTQQSAERELREAIAQRQFELHYQPVIDIGTRELVGVETLVRWRHPVRGMIPPDHFIPLAESTGLIAPLGDWILERACADAATWPAQVKVAINISAIQFKKGKLFELILATLVKTGLQPERLELEITETSLLENQEAHLTTIRQLKNLGLSIALDDFGTGFSSMNYLTIFPFDKIKIDKSFTKGVLSRTDCQAVVASSIALAKGLGITTTVEGIETEEQLDYMRSAGVELAQGYLFGKPVPMAEFGRDNAVMLTALVA
ncbi:PAS-domain containing protein [Bradyrhizobium sp.]|uniref:PAS-domain containing protein n=1 Tax=Bradyrhizobium sp. TaxID=376 RepID=UPI00238F1352|nr:PAS-domain containing protein [Bradyrhizobium sp.]MDE1936339.1 PAS-domain containing protein [Bradyrhizobium sp.]